MKKLLIILTLISVFACEITKEPYNGEEAILASIEKSKKVLNDVLDETDAIYKDGFSNIDDMRIKIQEHLMQELEEDSIEETPQISIEELQTNMIIAQAKITIVNACPVLFSNQIRGILLLGEDGIDARAALEVAWEQAEQVDFSNEYEVNKAIKKIESAWEELQLIIYSARFKLKVLFSECLGRIEN